MTKYLDENGLAYFWTKIKAWLSSHAPVKYFGQNWVEDTNNDYALVVGNGVDENNTVNVLVVEHDGNIVIGGDDSNKSVSFQGENATDTMIEFQSNSNNANGNALAIGAEGRTIIGSGGHAHDLDTIVQSIAQLGLDDPQLYIAAGDDVHVYTNLDNPNDIHELVFSENGDLLVKGELVTKQTDVIGNEHNGNLAPIFGNYYKNSNDTNIAYDEVVRNDTVTPAEVYRSFVVRNPANLQACGFYLHVDDNGNVAYSWSNTNAARKSLGLGQANGVFPLTIAQGGSNMTGVTFINTASTLIAAGSGVTITAAWASIWGKVIHFRIGWKRNSAISVPANGDIGNFTVGTLKSGYRPKLITLTHQAGLDDAGQGASYWLNTDGVINVASFESRGSAWTVAANHEQFIDAVYVLA